ncbi:MAG: hypothetical protein ACOY3X_01605 [Pseudomonadota bacterium]
MFHRCFAALAVLLAFAAPAGAAYLEIDDSALGEISGEGLVLALDDFSLRVAPTSYIELTGTIPENTSTPAPTAAGAGWKRADVRYYGLSFTGNAAGTDWSGTGCTGSGVNCPLGTGDIADFASVYNPYLLRVFQYTGYDFQGNLLNTAGTQPTVLELIGPSRSDTWRWSFWGEIEIARGTTYATSTSVTTTSPHPGNPAVAGCLSNVNSNNVYCGLQSQTTILGKASTTGMTSGPFTWAANRPPVLRLMQTSNSSDRTLGLTYQSALSGDFRFSVAQTASSQNVLHRVPDFSDTEGLVFRNVDAFLPLGRLHSQAITFDTTAVGATPGDGNFVMRLTPVPNVAAVYQDYYCGGVVPAAVTCTTANELTDFFGNTVTVYNNPNPETHGYVRWGCTSSTDPGCAAFTTPPTSTATNNGIYFTSPGGTVVNVGTSKLVGVMIQALTLTTKGL